VISITFLLSSGIAERGGAGGAPSSTGACFSVFSPFPLREITLLSEGLGDGRSDFPSVGEREVDDGCAEATTEEVAGDGDAVSEEGERGGAEVSGMEGDREGEEEEGSGFGALRERFPPARDLSPEGGLEGKKR